MRASGTGREIDAPLVDFPDDDVFRYTDREARAINKGEHVDWHQLKPMKEAAH
jgi:hypothetical protein